MHIEQAAIEALTKYLHIICSAVAAALVTAMIWGWLSGERHLLELGSSKTTPATRSAG